MISKVASKHKHIVGLSYQIVWGYDIVFST